MGWYKGNSGGKQHAVGSKTPNVWGLYDMHGGAREWCSDRYQGAYPLDLRIDPQGPTSGIDRVLRGGSIDSPKEECRAQSRGLSRQDTTWPDVGFRVVMDLYPQLP
jgi:formylglycine-generating enzyme required for sulfatase activity